MKEQHPDLKVEGLGDDIERPIAEMAQATSADTQAQAINEIAKDGKITTKTMGDLASQLGIEPGNLEGRLKPLIDGFRAQATKVIEAQSADLGPELNIWRDHSETQQQQPDAVSEPREPINVFLTESEAARILRVSTRTMQRWRLTGDGPPFVAAGGRRIYRRDALLAWADSRTFTSTSAADVAASHA